MKPHAAALALCLLALGCKSEQPQEPNGWSQQVAFLLNGGAEHEVTRISNPSSEYVREEVQVLAGPMKVSDAWAMRFDNAVIRLGESRDNETNLCIPNPGIRVSLAKGRVQCHIVLCFECSILLIEDKNGEMIVPFTSFVPVERELGKLAMEAFPNDRALAKVISERAN